VGVSAPPADGRANEAVVRLVSALLGVRRRQVRLARGGASRGKWVEVEGLSQDEASRRLAAALAAGGTGRGSAEAEDSGGG